MTPHEYQGLLEICAHDFSVVFVLCSHEKKKLRRQKAEEVKKSLGLSSPKPVVNSKEEKAEAIDLAAHLQLLSHYVLLEPVSEYRFQVKTTAACLC